MNHPARSFDTPSRQDATSRKLDARLQEIESLMQRVAHDGVVDRASLMVSQQLSSGGKRVRPRVALSACDALGVAGSGVTAWAASLELLHNATLVHDDIQDGDIVRRGKPTLWAVHGVAQAINAGDHMLMLAFVALREADPKFQGPLSILLAEAATRIVRGQVQELGLLESARFDMESYLNAARGKTGALFELPVSGAAIMAELPREDVQELASTFGTLGVAFQIQDDLVDLFGDKGRGEIGADIREGKVSALIVALLERRPDLREQVSTILRKSRQETTTEDILWVREQIVDSGADERVLGLLAQFAASVSGAPVLRRHSALGRVTAEFLAMTLGPIRPMLGESKLAGAGE